MKATQDELYYAKCLTNDLERKGEVYSASVVRKLIAIAEDSAEFDQAEIEKASAELIERL